MKTTGAHDSRQLDTGETVHLVRPPESKWHISSYDWSWPSEDGRVLLNARVFAQTLHWEGLEFETTDDAYSFVKRQLESGKAPRKERPRPKNSGDA